MSIINENLIYPERMYDLYDKLSEEELLPYLDNWGVHPILDDKWYCLKCTDEHTTSRLYYRNMNPVMIFIRPAMKWNKDINKYDYPEGLYDIKAQICSVDDSSYGIWLDSQPKDELIILRDYIMNWVSDQKLLNGDDFINKCVQLGFDPETIDYN